jgi:hypothetical protein
MRLQRFLETYEQLARRRSIGPVTLKHDNDIPLTGNGPLAPGNISFDLS